MKILSFHKDFIQFQRLLKNLEKQEDVAWFIAKPAFDVWYVEVYYFD